MVARPQPHHPDRAARPQRPRLRQDLEQRAQRIAAQDHHARAGREARAPASPDDPRILVDWAMRYGNPSIASRLEALQQAGCDRILIVPLYPQYAAATTATVCDKAFDALDDACAGSRRCASRRPITTSRSTSRRWRPRSKRSLAKLPFKPEVILASFHGMPKDYLAQRRSLLLPMRGDGAAAARAAPARRDKLDADLPVALRHGRMAEALHRRDGEGAGRDAA